MEDVMSYSPSKITIPDLGEKEKIAKISAGAIFSAAITVSGKILVWGNGEYG